MRGRSGVERMRGGYSLSSLNHGVLVNCLCCVSTVWCWALYVWRHGAHHRPGLALSALVRVSLRLEQCGGECQSVSHTTLLHWSWSLTMCCHQLLIIATSVSVELLRWAPEQWSWSVTSWECCWSDVSEQVSSYLPAHWTSLESLLSPDHWDQDTGLSLFTMETQDHVIISRIRRVRMRRVVCTSVARTSIRLCALLLPGPRTFCDLVKTV